jgi:hypothetical protein
MNWRLWWRATRLPAPPLPPSRRHPTAPPTAPHNRNIIIINPHQDEAKEEEEESEADADVNVEAEEEEAVSHATEVFHSVLFSPDLWPQQLWQHLDCGSKRALRATSVAMREQVDACIVMVVSPRAAALEPSTPGFTGDELGCGPRSSALSLVASRGALVRWPGMRDLVLLGVRYDAARRLQPLTTTTLVGLKSLTLRQVGLHAHVCVMHACREHVCRMPGRCPCLACWCPRIALATCPSHTP